MAWKIEPLDCIIWEAILSPLSLGLSIPGTSCLLQENLITSTISCRMYYHQFKCTIKTKERTGGIVQRQRRGLVCARPWVQFLALKKYWKMRYFLVPEYISPPGSLVLYISSTRPWVQFPALKKWSISLYLEYISPSTVHLWHWIEDLDFPMSFIKTTFCRIYCYSKKLCTSVLGRHFCTLEMVWMH